MDIISFNEAATANGRIEKFIKDPDSNSGIVTVPKVIGAGESVTIPAGRVAVLPNVQVNGEIVVEGNGEIFIPAGATLSKVVELEGNQTIAGVKTFSSSPIVPTPTTGTQVANKNYVDTKQSKVEVAYNANSSSYVPNTLSSGAIIERGSNDNGEYVKFADGTLICTANVGCSGNINIPLGSLYTTPATTWNFPAAFSSMLYHLSGCERFGVGNCFLTRADGVNETATSCSFKGARGASVNATPTFALTAIGRWK